MPSLLRLSKKQYSGLSIALNIDSSSVLSQRLNDRYLEIAILVDSEVEVHVG
jgi:hypothetical protein